LSMFLDLIDGPFALDKFVLHLPFSLFSLRDEFLKPLCKLSLFGLIFLIFELQSLFGFLLGLHYLVGVDIGFFSNFG
jgi:hypothetical protein